MNILHGFLFSILLLSSTLLIAQASVTGVVIHEDGKPIGGANVLLKNSENMTVAFSSTSADGTFAIRVDPGRYQVNITYLGFRTEFREVSVTREILDLKSIVMHEDPAELEAVFLKSEARIEQKGDTTIFKTDRFLNGTERNLNDILQTLPGIGISETVKITIGGKEVDRLLIDGEDLYKKQHQFATENIASSMVGNIELIRNYTDFETLKTAEKTGLTALNVTIKEEFKEKLTGTGEVGAGIENKYKIKPSLFNFGKKNKSSLITNFNNTGDSPLSIQDYLELSNPVDVANGNSSVSFSKNENIPQFLISEDKAKSRITNFATLSSIYSLSKNWKIDFYGILNHSKQERLLSKEQTLSTNSAPIKRLEENSIAEENLFGTAQLKSVYKRNEKSVFVFISHFDSELSHLRTNINNVVNGNIGSTIENFRPHKLISRTTFSYSEKFRDAIFTTLAFFNYNTGKENLDISSDQSFLDLDFDGENFYVAQNLNKEKTSLGLDLKYSFGKRKINFSLRSNTSLTGENLYSNSSNSELLENDLKLNSLKSVVSAELIYNLTPIFSVGQRVSYNYNLRKFDIETSELTFLDFKSNIKAVFSKNNIAELSYSYSHKTPTIENLIKNKLIINNRNMVSNDDVPFDALFPYHDFNYQHFIFNQKKNFSFIFNASHKRYLSSINDNVVNDQSFSLTKDKVVNLDKSTSLLLFLEKQLSSLPLAIANSTSLDISESGYFIDDYPSIFKTQSIGGFVEISSKFKLSPIHFKIGYKYTFEKFTLGSVTSNARREQPYLNLKGNITRSLFWELNNSYKLYMVESDRKGIFYLDPSLRYSKQNSNWEFTLSGTNVLNFNSKTITESKSFPGLSEERVTAILPGYILMGIKYKF